MILVEREAGLREDDSSRASTAAREENTKQARHSTRRMVLRAPVSWLGCTPKAIMEVEQWAKSMMQLWEQRLDAVDKAVKVEKR
ncbi:hypothetical protein KSZ_31150 [Dictyobacter formicarum]|uniref:Uncharacterized protein n=2 Tax=Dictyobacter formicarum TaxID=2778368 RepID=A0ABQ3VG15_9CHLR|nr:hypothetical protein KSZ_31150 [Dictyobacter formicarum]